MEIAATNSKRSGMHFSPIAASRIYMMITGEWRARAVAGRRSSVSKKKPAGEKYPQVNVTHRPDQTEKVRRLQKEGKLSGVFQAALDAA